jgi:hypothetical protein
MTHTGASCTQARPGTVPVLPWQNEAFLFPMLAAGNGFGFLATIRINNLREVNSAQ